ncbi:hypothetical protein TNCV_3085031 [Trichonephila clavipes]|nr:hypothetical protein TNCV_3085031 [Trichonephila clavipes]
MMAYWIGGSEGYPVTVDPIPAARQNAIALQRTSQTCFIRRDLSSRNRNPKPTMLLEKNSEANINGVGHEYWVFRNTVLCHEAFGHLQTVNFGLQWQNESTKHRSSFVMVPHIADDKTVYYT